jgi:hypothetical protein
LTTTSTTTVAASNSQREVQISPGVIDLLLEICKHYSIVQNYQ